MEFFTKVVNPILDNIVFPLVMLLFAVAGVVFVWGILEMILHADEAEGRAKGRNHMIGGLIGLLIMVSAWGIIAFISNTIQTL